MCKIYQEITSLAHSLLTPTPVLKSDRQLSSFIFNYWLESSKKKNDMTFKFECDVVLQKQK